MLRGLQLENFRRYSSERLEFGSGVNLIVGSNGSGKTTVIEAVELLIGGKRIRGSSSGTADLVKSDAEQSRLILDGESGAGNSFKIVGVLSRQNMQRNVLEGDPEARTAIFLPDMALNIRGAPARRRGMIDKVSQGTQPEAAESARRYNHALQQRNQLIRRARAVGAGAVSSQANNWGEQMIFFGEQVRKARDQTLLQLSDGLNSYYKRLSGGGELRCEIDECPTPLHGLTDGISEIDMRRGTTATGPHLDKIVFRLNDQDLREAGSNGEQRMAMISWVLAESELPGIKEKKDVILLLDDPLAELDEKRRGRLMAAVAETGRQTIITTPSLAESARRKYESAAVIDLEARSRKEISA